jgi:lambda family phage tail tape measure protein
MSKITVDFELKDSQKSVDGVDASGKRLNKTLERTQELMKGTRGGSRAANAAFQQTEYNTARGTVGTGASGRDFAKQSRELDGLVRLYAVYAANIFAAGAAFRALSEAMDTANMVQGLNQLGAASGVAMGGLAKRFAEASGGAISLRESMEATAKAVSSGLSQAQFLKLGEVAKKASQALGVNMSDAVSRLTRGITKLEPELLDELGIFTKVGQATEDYARAIGKPAAALTDFEKRQAFANAVLAEGAKKFGQIDIPTNPYDKLLATLKNVAQAGLEIVNNVLGPFAKLLSNNTGLLIGVLGLIGAKIVKDALPAIGQWRAGLKAAADEAKKRSSDIAASFGEGFVERTNAAFKIPDLQANLKKSEEEYRASRTKMAQMDTDFSKRVLKGGPGTDEKSLKSEQARLTKEINKLKADGLAVDNAQIVALEKQKAVVVALKNDMRALAAAQNAALNKSEGGSLGEQAGDFFRRNAARGAREKSQRLDALSNVSTMQREQGFSPAMSALKKDLDAMPNWINKARTGIAGVIIAGAGAVGTAIAGLTPFLGTVGVILGVLQGFASVLRSNEEEAARFASSLDLLKENSENAFRVLERLSKLDPLDRISVDNILAKGTALESLGSSLAKAFDDFETELIKRNPADKFTNFLASLVGQSSEQKLAKQISNTVQRAIQLSANGPEGKVVQTELAKLLQLPANASAQEITDALDKASPAVQKAAGKLVEDVGKKAVASAGSLKSFRDGLVESSKIYQDLINTTKNSTPLTKFAEDSSKKIIDLSKTLAMADLPEKLTTLRDLSTDINFLQLFPPQAARNILSTSGELDGLSKQLAEVEYRQNLYNDAIEKQNEFIAKTKKGRVGDRGDTIGGGNDSIDDARIKRAQDDIERLNKLNTGLNATKSSIKEALTGATAKFTESMRVGLIANIDIFTKGLIDAAAKARLEVQKVASGGINDPRLKAEYQKNLDLKAVQLDRNLLNTQLSLIESNGELRLAIMENTLSLNITKAGITGTPEEILSQLFKPGNEALLENYRSVDRFKQNKNKPIEKIRQELQAGGVTSGAQQGLGEALGQAQATASVRAQLASLAGKEEGIRLQAEFNKIDADRAVGIQTLNRLQKENDQEQLKFAEKKDSYTEAEFKQENERFILRKEELANSIRILEASSGINKLNAASATLGVKVSEQDLNYTLQQLDAAVKQSLTEEQLAKSSAQRGVEIAKAVDLKNREIKEFAQSDTIAAAALEKQISANKISQDQIAAKQQLGLIDEVSAKVQLDDLKVAEAKLDQVKQLTAAQSAYRQEVEKLELARLQAGGSYTGQQKLDDETARKRLADNYASQVAGIKTVTDAQIKSAEAFRDAGYQQLAYTELFKQAFKGMEDAIVNFVKTGKLSFKDMINSFLEGLLRYEIRQQQIALFSGLGMEGGLAKLFMGSLGIATTGSPISTGITGDVGAISYGLPGGKLAKGGAFDAGLRTFARGGMFTNSIVSEPTLFKFARGTGLMGEAGPEAIMPLKRDSNGNLGVRGGSGGGTTSVVVNNYGSEKATTKETTDSRGNRRIEVIVGDMVAGELNRVGSTTQQAMTASYGTAPLLARR